MKSGRLSSEDRRVQVLDAARSLFAKKGFSATTLDEIAARIGLSRPRIIQLFGSKKDIYQAIAETAYQDHPLDKDLAEPILRGDDFSVFQSFAFHILHHTANQRDREIFKILMVARLREDNFHRIHFHKKDTLMISRLEEYVSSRVKQGVFKKIDSRTIIYAYQAMISNLAIYKNVMKKMDFVSIEELSRDCARIFLEGLLSCPTRRSPIRSRK